MAYATEVDLAEYLGVSEADLPTAGLAARRLGVVGCVALI